MSINEFEKWPTDKRKYDMNYLRVFGTPCPVCSGISDRSHLVSCSMCDGSGYIVKERKPNEQGGTL